MGLFCVLEGKYWKREFRNSKKMKRRETCGYGRRHKSNTITGQNAPDPTNTIIPFILLSRVRVNEKRRRRNKERDNPERYTKKRGECILTTEYDPRTRKQEPKRSGVQGFRAVRQLLMARLLPQTVCCFSDRMN